MTLHSVDCLCTVCWVHRAPTSPEPEQATWDGCACGGVIYTVTDRDSVERAVARHNLTPRHLLWRIANLEREIRA